MAEGKRSLRRQFGWIRELPSGKFQASYLRPDGGRQYADHTFLTKGAAGRWLTLVEGEIIRCEWRPPGEVELGEYAARWIAERSLAPRTRELYEGLFRLHIRPALGGLLLDRVTPAVVRTWRTGLLDQGSSAVTVAKAYRLLRAVFNTAVDDREVRENPCRIKGADKEPTPERPTATVAQVYRLASVVPVRFKALILFAAFTGLRWGELIALRRCDLDLDEATVRVSRKFAELRDGTRVAGPPKTAAGWRTLVLPGVLLPVMREHLAAYAAQGTEALIFTGSKGAALRRTNFHKAVSWAENVETAGLPAAFHFHDLRHTGNTLAAASGASTRELMHRMGHASMRAALIYQHATRDRDREIADALSQRIEARRPRSDAEADDQADDGDGDDGAAGALARVG